MAISRAQIHKQLTGGNKMAMKKKGYARGGVKHY